ncbi:TonB-dependent receptor domain-containing protein [Flavilitoribacter nigricans]|uniref:TonB-dependent receptor n=1 Tax=Flavilitoribacter nigricans (strain ATCC 23147 / DSM 23189 / NBRC 102662 / NCIMB 1420 / SS-2) TaxID=1122177 RepID=A0A2D0N703_FLAN2|nr:TonB-dependent receptor [Flavilitoribacter nigricans]PHN04170.1 TonB-dependent receptor [Flavilitoribacter nigricans DSM 23189 = NBRC 102662]
MRSLISCITLLSLTCSLFGQIEIRGRIIDTTSGEAIEYASVTLHSAGDSSLINGVVTDQSGQFLFSKLQASTVYVIAQFLGYEPYRSEVFSLDGVTDLGTISLGVNASVLREVEVTGRAITSLHRLDKQVFDAGQFQSAQGGNATDVLRNLPSITVNALGEISVRGATGFIVMINGKPVQSDPAVMLGQIPANAIEDIEIITAPSAKYDPDGKAGIINIKTRQGVTDGLLLIANGLIGLPSIEPYDNAEAARRFGGDITVNYKKGKWDLSAGFDYSRNDVSGRREGYVNTYLNEVLTEFPSDGERSFDRENYSGRASVLFAPSDRQSIGASFYAGKRTQYRTADILYLDQQRTRITEGQFLGPEAYWDLYRESGTVFPGGNQVSQFTFYNENLRVRRGDFLIGALDYTVKFANTSSLKISGLYEHTLLGGPTDNVSLGWPQLRDTFQLQYNDNDNPLDGYRLQLDYAGQLGDAKWESGYQYRYLKHPGDFIYLDRNFATNTWETNPLFTNSIELRRQIHSVYSQLSGEVGRLQYSGGLRLEYFDRQVDIAEPDTLYTLDQFNFFPSFNLQYDLGNNLSAKAGYSRRIERTTTFKMTPFPEREHSETLEQGDAALLPEYIDLVEAGLVKNWEDNSLYATVYFRNINNVINRVNTIFNDTILNRIYTNAGRAQVYGLELGTTLYPTGWWRLFLGTNIYNYRIKGQLFGDRINTANTIYSINATSNFKLMSTMDLQLGLNYLSERVTAQGRDSRFYNPSLTLRKTFLDKRLAVSFQWLNLDLGLLSSNEQRITTVRDNFYTTTNYVYEVDILQIGLTYQINQSSKKVNLLKSEFGEKEF